MTSTRVRDLIRNSDGDELARALGAWFDWRRFRCGQNYDETIAEVVVMRPSLDRGEIDELLQRAEELEQQER